MKALALIPAAFFAAAPATAQRVDPGYGVRPVNSFNPAYAVERGVPYSIRQCTHKSGRIDLCYNQRIGRTVSLLNVPILPIYWEVDRVRRVRCDVDHPGDTVRAAMAAGLCPQLLSLPRAPFLE